MLKKIRKGYIENVVVFNFLYLNVWKYDYMNLLYYKFVYVRFYFLFFRIY